MENAIYATLTRQAGLMREMQVVANNVANIATTGFRREGVIFSEYVNDLGTETSLSMARASARNIDLTQGDFSETGGQFDFAISGPGFFLIETPSGNHLSRAGHFTVSAEGELVTADGHRLLDEGGAPIELPPGATQFHLGRDGTLSTAGGPVARVGLWQPGDPNDLRHIGGTMFSTSAPEPLEAGGTILQGFLESSNTEPISEIARMIEVQRAYELGQSLLDREDQRIRNVIQTLGR